MSSPQRPSCPADLRQLQQFIVVAEELNFRRAASRLCMTQPPLSTAIKRLEEAVGTPLFQRNRSAVSLTPAGVVLLREARYLLRQAEVSFAEARAASAGAREILRVKSIDSAMLNLLPEWLERFCSTEKGIRLSLTTGSSQDVISAVEGGSIDLGVCVPGGASYPHLRTFPFGRERFCLAVHASHRFAGRAQVRLPELAGEHIVTHYPHAASPGYHAAVSVALQQTGAHVHVHQSETHLLATLGLVRLEVGLALIPDSMRRIGMDGVVYVEVVSEQGDAVTYPIVLAVRQSGASDAAVRFCEFVQRRTAAAGRS
ncbi:MAG: LysR family transcriptional regulator [Pigmentiphaga sp.]|uniref:LysR family transcriptional regulator n=1 Tax=Pigmentiphaga sp. TaxID=1977564 RepID=UPI0029AD6CF7|nr:LysR family transcriptional regulator [Pigmentiphaga sp.]MDX3905911.1 LysR family transcriptional regulator [Pigmentiphaga sp.]